MSFVEFFSEGGPVVTVHLYALCVVVIITSFLAHREKLKKLALAALLGTGCFQLIVLLSQILHTGFADLNRGFYFSLLAWGVLLVGIVAWIRRKLAVLSMAIAPVSLVLCLVGLFSGETTPSVPDNFSAMFSVFHIGALFVSFGLLTLAFGAGCLFILQEKGIKSKARLSRFRKELPSLSSLDRVNAFATVVGFPLFSVGLFFGLIGARVAWGSLLSNDPKELVSLLCWGLFALLFHQRLGRGWRGHKPAVLLIVLFVLCVFSLIGVNVFMDTHHSF